MNYPQLILQAIMLLSYIIVFIYQFNSLRHLKSKLGILEKFQSIFDIDKIDGYVKIIEKKAEGEIEVHKRAQINKHLKEAIEKEARAQGEEILHRYNEIILVFGNIMLEQSHQDNAYIFDLLPLNKEYLVRVMEGLRKSV